MELYKKLVKRIDLDFGYDNEKLAKDLQTIAEKHYKKKIKVSGNYCDYLSLTLDGESPEKAARECGLL